MTELTTNRRTAAPIKIWVGTTWFKTTCDQRGILTNGYSIRSFVARELMERDWDPRQQAYVLVHNYTAYDRANQLAIFPRYALDKFLMYLGMYGLPYELIEVQPYTPRTIKIKTKSKFSPRENQGEMIKFLIDPNTTYKPLAAQTGIGKAVAVDTPVRTPHGWRVIGSLQVGDTVLSWNGEPTRVIGVYPQGYRRLYRFNFDHGRWVDAADIHLWTIRTAAGIQVATTLEILDLLEADNTVYTPCYQPGATCTLAQGTWEPLTTVTPLSQKQPCVCIAVDHPDKLYVIKDDIVTHNTFMTEYAISELKYPALIVLGFFVDQWYKSILQHTTLRKEDIYVVQGFEALKTLWDMVKNGYQPKIVLFSTRTLSLYAVENKFPYDHLPSYDKFQQKLGFGILVHDETHLNFYTNTQIDMRSNIKHNIFLSATYQRSDYQGKKIFNTVFPADKLFGGQFVKKYTVVHMIRYRLGISLDASNRFTAMKGYMHAKYEKWLIKHKSFFNNFTGHVLHPVITMYFTQVRKDDQKLLILCQTQDFVLEITKYLSSVLTVKAVAYFSGDSKYGDPKQLKNTVIVSTIKSCSTGVDIKGLKTCINTVSFNSEPQAAQCMGRLRQIPNEETIYVDLWNGDIPKHQYHQRSRLQVYKQKALRWDETSL